MSKSVNNAKAEARRIAKERRAMAHDVQSSRAACARLVQFLAQYPKAVVAGYLPIQTEIDPRPAMEALSQEPRLCVPVMQGAGRALRFAKWAPEIETAPGAFGVAEPTAKDWITPDIIVLPLLGFTRSGVRLGYGGGFYDRTLAQLATNEAPIAIGFAYSAQEFDHLPYEPTDAQLDWVVTETELISCKR